MTSIRKRFLVAIVAVSGLAFLIAPGAARASNRPKQGSRARFGTPTLVTPPLGFGYEPTVLVDRFNNIFAIAHKENWQLVLAPDLNSPTYTRSMSWAWVSEDGGNSFQDIPGLTPLSLEQHDFGDEGDIAFDDANHLYMVDTNVVDDTFTRWTVTGHGLGDITADFTRPVIPTLQDTDDRPWVTAHGNGHVFYFGNEGDKKFGGRYLVYQSYDGGMTFSPVPTVLENSGWCRPAADHRPGSKYVYALCTNDTGLLYAYVSSDDGHTFKRITIGPYNKKMALVWQSWPTPVVAPNGTLYALFVDAKTVDGSGTPIVTTLRLLTSKDHGLHWKSQDITPSSMRGQFEYGWMAVSPRSSTRLGLGIYYRPNTKADWRVYGAIWKAGQIPQLVSLDQTHPVANSTEAQAPPDYLSSSFGPDDRLSVVWTQLAKRIAPYVAFRYIYYARSL
ncbi:MAG TPA: hypothetical protein VF972_10330 [Actinomycetota bacterium]